MTVTGEAQAAAAWPVIRWRGWRPLPLDMASDEQGGQVYLVLGREGDLALLPTASVSYLCYAPLSEQDAWWGRSGVEPLEVTHSGGVAREMMLGAVREMEAEGWMVIGRLQATFHGVDSEDDFWERMACQTSEGAPGVASGS